MNEYVRQILENYNAGSQPARKRQVSVVRVLHDDWCAIFRGGACTCRPTVSRPVVPENN